MKIDHIGIAVRDLNEAVGIYKIILGKDCEGIEEIKEQSVKVAFFKLGEAKIELVQSINSEGNIAKFIEKRGEGMHHIALLVKNIEEVLKILKGRGIKLIDEKPKIGAGGKKIAFLHPKSSKGVLIELVEKIC